MMNAVGQAPQQQQPVYGQPQYGQGAGFQQNRANGGGFNGKPFEDRCKNKLFIGGLDHSTTKEDLEQYFSKFGTITDSVVMSDQVTKRSRGFGFVTYDQPEPLDQVQNSRPHTISNKQVDTRRAMPKEQVISKEENQSQNNRKVFIGGIPASATDDDVKEYCAKFGEIENIYVNRKQDRHYGFATFVDHDNADKMILQPEHEFHSTKIQVKKAINKKAQQNSMNSSGNGSFGAPYGQMAPNMPPYGGYQQGYMGGDSRPQYGGYQMQQRPQFGQSGPTQSPGFNGQQRPGGAQPYGSAGYQAPYMQQGQYGSAPSQYGARPAAGAGVPSMGSYQYSATQAYNPNK